LLASLIGFGARADDPAAPEVPKAELQGVVVDEAGHPIAGAKVRAIGYPADSNATTESDGAFRLSLGDRTQDRVYALLLARSLDDRIGLLAVVQEKPEPIRLVLRPSRAITVRVVDQNEHPVAGAEVRVLLARHSFVDGKTDDQGEWRGLVPAAAHSWAIVARKRGKGLAYESVEQGTFSKAKPRPFPNRLTLTLPGAQPRTVKTVDRDGRPLAGVKIGPWFLPQEGRSQHLNIAENTDFWQETGPDGTTTFDWLPEFPGSEVPILVHSESHFLLEFSRPIKAADAGSVLTLSLLPRERLAGRVTFKDGRPAAGVLVSATGRGGGDHYFSEEQRTDAEGRYAFNAYSQEAYIVAVSDPRWTAAYRASLILKPGQTIQDADLVIGPPTRLHGRVTTDPGDEPAAGSYLSVQINKGPIPDALRVEKDPYVREVSLVLSRQTDSEGRYEFLLAPGEYVVRGPGQDRPETIMIPETDPPTEIVRDFHRPRPKVGPLTIQVVDGQGRPVEGAVVNGQYRTLEPHRWFEEQVTDAEGRLVCERSLHPLALHAVSANGQLAGMSDSVAEATEARIVVGPIAVAIGRMVDLEGKTIPDRELRYGVRIDYGEPGRGPFTNVFGGTTLTDPQGGFTIGRLVPGATYQVNIKIDDTTSRTATQIVPKAPGPFDLGEIQVDPNPTKPYVPPTPEQRSNDAFAAGKAKPAADRVATLLVEAHREYTRPLLLFGTPSDPACVDLFRKFYEDSPVSNAIQEKAGAKESPGKPVQTAQDLRWEFEFSAFDGREADVKELAGRLGIEAGAGIDGKPPVLAVLGEDGKVSATYSLTIGSTRTLDAPALSTFLSEHTLPTRDANQMLAEARARAGADDKRVFLILSASWCGPCRLLARFLAAHKAELEPHYVFVKLDISRDAHAEEFTERYQGDNGYGVPWFAILDPRADDKVLADCNSDVLRSKYGNGNIGFPSDPEGIDHFVSMIERTAPRVSRQTLDTLKADLSKKP
jgi:hypothetical protein